MDMIAKGKRKTGNDGKGKSGKKLPSPGRVSPTSSGSKGGANQLPCKKTSKGMGY